MPAKPSSSEIRLHRGWPSCVKTATLHVISLAQFALAYRRTHPHREATSTLPANGARPRKTGKS
jgi:hypothetical protein